MIHFSSTALRILWLATTLFLLFFSQINAQPLTPGMKPSAVRLMTNPQILDHETVNCTAKGDFPWHDWIAKVKMGDLDHASGKSQYADFTATTLNVNAGVPVGVTLETGFSYFTYDEYWKIWIDYNQNGIFEEATETFLSLTVPKPPDGTPFYAANTTAFVQGGFSHDFTTKMRVAMKRGSYPTPCETFAFGEVEDYSIHIAPGGGHSRPDLSIVNFLAASSGVQGTVVPCTFDLKNSGTAYAIGNYVIGAYLSTDGQLSADDALVGTIQTGNTPIGTIPNVQGAIAVPANLAPGIYFLILKADINNTIAELNELNNLSSRPFTVLPGANGGGADLELTLTADHTTLPVYSNMTVTLTAKNTGNQTIQLAKIAIGVCEAGTSYGFTQTTQLVYAGTPPPPAYGTYDQVAQGWTITSLAAGQTAQLILPLFTLTAAERKIIAFSYAQSPADPDSQPGGGPANCLATQDDEAGWTINAGQSARPSQGDRSGLATFEKSSNLHVYPNPAGESVCIAAAGWQGQPITVSLYNQLSVKVLEKHVRETPSVVLDLSGIGSGQYFLKIEMPGERAVFEKLVVARRD